MTDRPPETGGAPVRPRDTLDTTVIVVVAGVPTALAALTGGLVTAALTLVVTTAGLWLLARDLRAALDYLHAAASAPADARVAMVRATTRGRVVAALRDAGLPARLVPAAWLVAAAVLALAARRGCRRAVHLTGAVHLAAVGDATVSLAAADAPLRIVAVTPDGVDTGQRDELDLPVTLGGPGSRGRELFERWRDDRARLDAELHFSDNDCVYLSLSDGATSAVVNHTAGATRA